MPNPAKDDEDARPVPLHGLSPADLPPVPDLQRAVDRWDLLFRVQLIEIKPGSAGRCSALIEGRLTEFECERASIDEVVRDLPPDTRAGWSHAYGFRGLGERVQSLAALIAKVSYALATGGAVHEPDIGAVRDFTAARQGVDELLAIAFRQMPRYVARYPSDEAVHPTGPGSVTSRVL